MELSSEQQEAIKQQKDHCPFCKIIAGEIPAKKVYEDDKICAILDINPAKPGHLLVMPKEHYPILPLIPEETFDHLFMRAREISKHLRKALLAKHCSVFIANGAAAGQQSTHFLIHIIPSDKPLNHFELASKQQDSTKHAEVAKMLAHNLPLMLRRAPRSFSESESEGGLSDLALFIEENPELKQLIIEKPEAVIAGIEENPSLKPLFEGVDIMQLSSQLKEAAQASAKVSEQPVQETPAEPETEQKPASEEPEKPPRAADMSDSELFAFVERKEKLRELLLNDLDTLQQAAGSQEKLKVFFSGSSVQEVLERYLDARNRANDPTPGTSRRFGGVQ